jgi:hypothetical protein
MQGYAQSIEYWFEVGGRRVHIIDWVSDGAGQIVGLSMEDPRKNGQEDCHAAAGVELDAGRWVYDEDGCRSFDEEWGSAVSRGILEYLDTNPLPKEM